MRNTNGPNSHARTVLRNSYSFGPHQDAHFVAARAAISLAIPLLVLYLIDRSDLAMYASFGAFSAIYGRNDAYPRRLRMQFTAGLAIVISMLAGTTLSIADSPNWLKVLCVSLIAGLVTLLSFRLGWRPTGPVFTVFSAGACALIPAEPSSYWHVLVLGGGAVLSALTVTTVLALRQIPMQQLFRATPTAHLQQNHWVNTVSITVATLLSGWAGLILFDDHWYWAMVAAIAVLTGANIHARLTRGVQRFLGTLIGVVFAAALMALNIPVIAILIIAIVCQGVIELLILRNYAAAMIFITIIALLMVNMASPNSASTIIRDRVLETLLGVSIGMATTIAVQFIDLE